MSETHARGGPGPLQTIPALLARNARERGAAVAYREKEFGIWQSWTWAEAQAEIEAAACGLLEQGLEAGDKVAVIGRNRPSLYWSMVAAQMCGATPVPLYQDAVADELAYVLEHSGARMVIAGDQEQVDKVLEVQDRALNVRFIVYVDARSMRKYDHSAMCSFAQLQERGRAASDRLKPRLEEIAASQGYDDTCVMLYTSGTTGRSKGVVLSNRNIIESSKNASEFDKLGPDEQGARVSADGLGWRLHLLDGPGDVERVLRQLPGTARDDV